MWRRIQLVAIGKSRFVFVLIATFCLATSLFVGSALVTPQTFDVYSNDRLNKFTLSEIVVDGNLSSGEWTDAEHKIQWYMDADPVNSDGYNYMYIDEDQYNLYIALDLCSDQTGDPGGEWIGLWLNTNEAFTNASMDLEWEATLNDGLESLLFDVESVMEVPFFDPAGSMAGLAADLKSIDDLMPVDGALTGNLSDIEGFNDGQTLNMTSVFNGTHYVYRMDVEIDIAEYYYTFKELYADHTLWVELGSWLWSNVTLNQHYLSIQDSSGNLYLPDSDQTISINTGTTTVWETLRALPGNFTADNRAVFSFVGVNDAPFKTSYDTLRANSIMTNQTNLQGTNYVISSPFTSIMDYDLAWSFGPSENNATDHRTFEFKITKRELEGYETDTDLGVIVGGYGTLSAWPNTHNWVLQDGTHTGILYKNTTAYHYYPMPLKEAPTTTGTPSTTTTPTGSTTPPPNGGDITQLLLIAGGGGAVVLLILAVYILKKK
jgi:hypothetical protein